MTVATPTARVSELTSGREGRTSRVSSQVFGQVSDQILWFESDDVELAPYPEAFASALLVPALESGLALTFDQPLPSTWLSNCRQLLRVYHEWWGYEEHLPVSPSGDPQRFPGSLKTALCFTGGVDSFHTLLRSGHEIDFLVNAQGFVDTPLEDFPRLIAIENSIREVARKTGTTPIFIRTNFLELPMVAKTSWERAHGGGLIALGHLLSSVVARLLISSSYTFETARPWGSHWMTDPLGSSASLQVIHVGAELKRNEKLWAIAGEPLVREHLHVCWENLAPTGNCSRCDKCIRTRLQLLECDQLRHFSCFEGEESLVQDIDSLPVGDGQMRTHRRLLENRQVDRRILRAIDNLVTRTERARDAGSAPISRLRRVWSLLQRLAK